MTIKSKLKRFLKILNPEPEIGGLEVTDSSLRFIKIAGDELIQASLRLPPEIITEGKIKDRSKFVAALLNLHSQIAPPKSVIHIIASLSSANIYTQAFILPSLPESHVEEAAKLNLEMISPIDIKNAYYDWQTITETTKDGERIELLGVFANNIWIEEFIGCFREAGFLVVAVEFLALSLSRLIKELGIAVDHRSYLVLNVSSDGVDFLIFKNGNLYFDHFNSWRLIQGGEMTHKISFDHFRNFIVREIQRVLNFYMSRSGEQVNDLILTASGFNKEIADFIKINFPFKIQELTLKKFSSLSPTWLGSLGAALRGLIPRSKDKLVSLTAIGTEKEYYQSRVQHFVRIWRTIIAASLGFVLLFFLIIDMFLINMANSLNNQLVSTLAISSGEEIAALQNKAAEFNRLAALAIKAQNLSPKWSPFFEDLQLLAGRTVAFERIYFNIPNMTVSVVGRASSEAAAVDFKNTLVKQEKFGNVNLPLADISTAPDGKVSFQLTFKIEKPY